MADPIKICFSRLLLITMIWRPFRARRPGGRFPGFQPWETSNKAVRPERARDGVGEMPFECYGKGIGHFLGRRYNLPLANNGHRHKVERWRGTHRNMFFASVTYNNDLAPFQGALAGWAVPRVETLG